MMDDSLQSTLGNTVELHAVVAKALSSMDENNAQSKNFNVAHFADELNQALWWGAEPGSSSEEKQSQQRQRVKEWALREIETLTLDSPKVLYRLRIVLTTLSLSSDSGRDAIAAVKPEMTCSLLMDALVKYLAAMSMGAPIGHSRSDSQQWYKDALDAGRNKDYRNLGNLIRHLELQFPPDANMAVMLLVRFAPDKLARHIEERQDVFFSVAVRNILSEDALKFALSVNDITFKFVCASQLADMQMANVPEVSVNTFRELLLQVAQTDHWRAFLFAFTRYPHADTVTAKVLSETLVQLTPAHWADFIDAVELWTHAGTVGPVASILVPFLHTLGSEKSAAMWELAFDRWNRWDYGRHEKDKHLLAPSVCSFDFPVAMHYALLPLDIVQAEETRLLKEIAAVEQKWFTGITELITYRNRLSSRLRLVRHGITIRNPPQGGASPLPPGVVPASEYDSVRYHFYDVNAPVTR